jgi:hypothetical protein
MTATEALLARNYWLVLDDARVLSRSMTPHEVGRVTPRLVWVEPWWDAVPLPVDTTGRQAEALDVLLEVWAVRHPLHAQARKDRVGTEAPSSEYLNHLDGRYSDAVRNLHWACEKFTIGDATAKEVVRLGQRVEAIDRTRRNAQQRHKAGITAEALNEKMRARATEDLGRLTRALEVFGYKWDPVFDRLLQV